MQRMVTQIACTSGAQGEREGVWCVWFFGGGLRIIFGGVARTGQRQGSVLGAILPIRPLTARTAREVIGAVC